jgi:hypothetical protein
MAHQSVSNQEIKQQMSQQNQQMSNQISQILSLLSNQQANPPRPTAYPAEIAPSEAKRSREPSTLTSEYYSSPEHKKQDYKPYNRDELSQAAIQLSFDKANSQASQSKQFDTDDPVCTSL